MNCSLVYNQMLVLIPFFVWAWGAAVLLSLNQRREDNSPTECKVNFWKDFNSFFSLSLSRMCAATSSMPSFHCRDEIMPSCFSLSIYYLYLSLLLPLYVCASLAPLLPCFKENSRNNALITPLLSVVSIFPFSTLPLSFCK